MFDEEDKRNITEALDKFMMTINIFIGDCQKVYGEGSVSIIEFVSDPEDEVKEHYLNDEYKTEKYIIPQKLFFTDTWKQITRYTNRYTDSDIVTDMGFDQFLSVPGFQKLRSFLNYLKKKYERKYSTPISNLKNIYLHITCTNNVDAIMEGGLYSETDKRITRIGDREEEEKEEEQKEEETEEEGVLLRDAINNIIERQEEEEEEEWQGRPAQKEEKKEEEEVPKLVSAKINWEELFPIETIGPSQPVYNPSVEEIANAYYDPDMLEDTFRYMWEGDHSQEEPAEDNEIGSLKRQKLKGGKIKSKKSKRKTYNKKIKTKSKRKTYNKKTQKRKHKK